MSRVITAEDVAEMERLYYEGLSFYAIGRLVGCSHQTVRNHMVAGGHHMVISQRVPPADSRKMAELYQKGVSAADIADRFGWSEKAVMHAVHEHGVPLHYPKMSANSRKPMEAAS